MSHKLAPPWINADMCRVGLPPMSAGTGLELQRLTAHLMQWQEQQAVLTATGIPEPDKMIDPVSLRGNYHFCLPPPDRVDAVAARNYGIIWREWRYNRITGGGALIPWYIKLDRDFVAVDELLIDSGVGPGVATSTYGNTAFDSDVHVHYRDSSGAPLTIPSAAGGFHHACVKTEAVLLAALSVFPAPIELLTAEQVQVPVTDYVAGRIIRGHAVGCTGSLGTIARLIGDGGSDEESCAVAGRRLLWSFCHGRGIWMTAFDGGVTVWGAFGGDSDCRVQGRGLAPAAVPGYVWPALVITASAAGTKIEFEALDATGATWAYTTTGLEAETMIHPSSVGAVPPAGLALDDPGATTGIQVTATSVDVRDELTIHSAQIWEGDPW